MYIINNSTTLQPFVFSSLESYILRCYCPGGGQRRAVQDADETGTFTGDIYVYLHVCTEHNSWGYVGVCWTVSKCTYYLLLFWGEPASSWRMFHDLKLLQKN